MDNLQVAVLDEGRVVTYKWLGAFLSSPSNEAKKMLFTFAKKNAGIVQATYLVGGTQKDGSYAVTLTSAERLEETKKSLERVVTVHVYSVQKQLPKDIRLITAPERQQELDLFTSLQQDPSKMLVRPTLSAIRCADATRRSLEPRRAKQQQQQKEKASGKAKATSAKKQEAKAKAPSKGGEKAAAATEEKAANAKAPDAAKKKTPAKKSSGLGSFFDKQRAAAKAKPTATTSTTKTSVFDKGVKEERQESDEGSALAGKKRAREAETEEPRVKEEKKRQGVDIGAFWAKKAPAEARDISQEVLPSQPRKRIKRKATKAAMEDDSIFEDDDQTPLLQESQEEADEEGEEVKEEAQEDVAMEEVALDESMGSPSILDSSEEEEEEVMMVDTSQEPTPVEKGALDKFLARPPKESGPTEVVKVHSSPGPSPGRVKVTKRKLVDGYYQFVDEWETVEGSGPETVEATEQKAKQERSQKETREKAAKAISKATGQASLTSFFKKK